MLFIWILWLLKLVHLLMLLVIASLMLSGWDARGYLGNKLILDYLIWLYRHWHYLRIVLLTLILLILIWTVLIHAVLMVRLLHSSEWIIGLERYLKLLRALIEKGWRVALRNSLKGGIRGKLRLFKWWLIYLLTLVLSMEWMIYCSILLLSELLLLNSLLLLFLIK